MGKTRLFNRPLLRGPEPLKTSKIIVTHRVPNRKMCRQPLDVLKEKDNIKRIHRMYIFIP